MLPTSPRHYHELILLVCQTASFIISRHMKIISLITSSINKNICCAYWSVLASPQDSDGFPTETTICYVAWRTESSHASSGQSRVEQSVAEMCEQPSRRWCVADCRQAQLPDTHTHRNRNSHKLNCDWETFRLVFDINKDCDYYYLVLTSSSSAAAFFIWFHCGRFDGNWLHTDNGCVLRIRPLCAECARVSRKNVGHKLLTCLITIISNALSLFPQRGWVNKCIKDFVYLSCRRRERNEKNRTIRISADIRSSVGY